MHENDDEWIQRTFGKPREELTIIDIDRLHTISRILAEQVTNYGDERLEDVLARIEEINASGELPMTILK